MRAIELIRTLMEGGNAFPDVGSIYIDEIGPTLRALSQLLQIPHLENHVLGSVGKAKFSGDIDIALDLDRDQMKELSLRLRDELGNKNVVGTAGNVTIRFPIQDYDAAIPTDRTRTGLVQVDLIPGEVGWMRTFYHSAGEKSKLKGVHRNFALQAIARNLDRKESSELDSYDRPAKEIRWAWGPKFGLQKVEKESIKNPDTGKWNKKQKTVALTDPIRDPSEIAKILFKGKATADDLDSVESIVNAIKKAYPKQKANKIFKDIAKLYQEYERVRPSPEDVPQEIARYMS